MSRLVIPGAAAGRDPGEIILPGALGNRRRAGGLTIHVPRGHETGPVRMIGVCHVCGAEFHNRGEEVAWERHVARCRAQHLDTIRENSPREQKRGSIFDPDFWDPEAEAHVKEVGKRMLAEGRLEMKPNERVVTG